jgi:hypothetical protein
MLEVRMHPRYLLALATFLLLLGACGQPDVVTRVPPTPTQQPAGHGIADLISAAPQPGQTVEVDAYYWIGYGRGTSYFLDAQGCPVAGTFLTDWPVSGVLHFPGIDRSNASQGYPPDADPWLIPISVLINPIPATLVPSYNPSTPIPSLRPVPDDSLFIPYHGRLRGHFGDPAYAACAHSNRIFVVEAITVVYDQAGPWEPPMQHLQPPADYASWPQYHDTSMGYSFAYATDWSVEPVQEADVLSAVAVHTAQAPDSPIIVRVHAGETRTDPYDATAIPELIKRQDKTDQISFFNQDFVSPVGDNHGQHLQGFLVDRAAGDNMRTMAVLISAHGRTYEIAVRYPIGLHANQSLLDAYELLLDRFQLDAPPEPSPTAPIKHVVGTGPFLTQDEMLAVVRRKHGDTFELTEARLVSEAEMRQLTAECSWFFSHPDGVWLVRIRGVFDGQNLALLLGLDATTGKQLCHQATTIGTPLPTKTRGPDYPWPTTPLPTMIPASPYPAPIAPAP